MILKANILLANYIFSAALFLAERIERNLPGKTRLVRYGLKSHYAVCIFDQYSCILVLELGAGSALPSLLLSTRATPPISRGWPLARVAVYLTGRVSMKYSNSPKNYIDDS